VPLLKRIAPFLCSSPRAPHLETNCSLSLPFSFMCPENWLSALSQFFSLFPEFNPHPAQVFPTSQALPASSKPAQISDASHIVFHLDSRGYVTSLFNSFFPFKTPSAPPGFSCDFPPFRLVPSKTTRCLHMSLRPLQNDLRSHHTSSNYAPKNCVAQTSPLLEKESFRRGHHLNATPLDWLLAI